MKRSIRMLAPLVLAAAACGLTACSTPEDKVEGFNKRGLALLQKGDVVKARLEFQNALQINPSTVPALYGLAVIAERARDWQAAYDLLGKVVELAPTHVDARIKLGKLELASGQLDKALASSEAVLKLKADSADAFGLQAAVFLKMNDFESAAALAKQALAKEPRHIDSLVVLASERLKAGDAERAIAYLDKGLETNERNVSLQIIKAQALQKLSRTDKAEEVLRRLIVLFPDNTDYRYLLASFYVQNKQLGKAEAEHRALVAVDPKATATKLELVRFLGATRGMEPAAAELEKFVLAQPKIHELRLALAGLRLQQNRDVAAIALWKEVIASAGSEAAGLQARSALASYHLARKDKAAAKPMIEEVLAKDGRNEQALLLRASLAVDERRLDDAVGDLRTILRDAPESARAQLLLARTHELQGLRDLATQHYANAAKIGRFAPQFAMPYAEYLVKTGRSRQVEGVLRELLRTSPGHVPALRLLAQSYLRSGDLAGAQAVADEAAKLQGQPGIANEIKGGIQFARKDFDGSISSFKKAYQSAPNDPQAMVTLVRSYLLANKPREALAFLRSVLAASPQNHPAQVLQGQLLAQTGNRDAGREVLQKAIAQNPTEPQAYQALVNMHVAAHDLTEALEVADRGLKAVPADYGLRLSRAAVLELQGKPEEAITVYEALLAERPNAMIVANNLAALLADHRKDAASLRRAYELAQGFRGTDNPLLKDTVGWTAHLAGKTKEAAEFLKSAAAGAPDLAVVHYHYGVNQLALNNAQAAKEALRRSIELAKEAPFPFPQVDDARKTLQRL